MAIDNTAPVVGLLRLFSLSGILVALVNVLVAGLNLSGWEVWWSIADFIMKPFWRFIVFDIVLWIMFAVVIALLLGIVVHSAP